MKLYEIEETFEHLIELYSEAETQSERDEIAKEIEAIIQDRDIRIVGLIKSIRNTLSDIDQVKKEVAALTSMKTALENKLQRKKDFLSENYGGYKPIACPVPFHWQNRSTVVVTDEAILPPSCYTVPTPPAPKVSKTAIKNLLDQGNEIPGAEIQKVWTPVFPRDKGGE